MAGHLADEGQLPNKLKAKKSNILWSGTAWTWAKQLTHCPSFSRNGTTITVNSFSIITVKEEIQYLGYLEDFYENKKGQKRVKVIQADCIDALATVLTPGDYEKYISLVPKKLSSGVYMCYGEFKNNKVVPFSLSELEGYYNQMIFTMSRSQQVQLMSKGHMLHEVKDITREDPSTQRLRGSRSVGESGILVSESQFLLVEPQCKLSFEVGDYLEVLCMRGCWFRCKVLQVSQKRMKVQYDDIQDCDGPEKLEEWVPSYRVVGSDKLGMRCTGRLPVRPRPLEDSFDIFFEVGAAVDAWWSNG